MNGEHYLFHSGKTVFLCVCSAILSCWFFSHLPLRRQNEFEPLRTESNVKFLIFRISIWFFFSLHKKRTWAAFLYSFTAAAIPIINSDAYVITYHSIWNIRTDFLQMLEHIRIKENFACQSKGRTHLDIVCSVTDAFYSHHSQPEKMNCDFSPFAQFHRHKESCSPSLSLSCVPFQSILLQIGRFLDQILIRNAF